VKVAGWFEGGEPILLADGRVLFVAHGDGKAATWNPQTGAWRKAAGLNKWRSQFAAIALRDGRVLIAGGRNTSDQSYSSAYTWDPGPDAWTKVGLMSTARAAASIAMLPDGRILVAGGYFAFAPDWGSVWPPSGPGLASFAARTAGSDPGTGPSVRLASVRLPLADVEVPPEGRALATAEIFDPTTGEWSTARPMRYSRAGAPAITLADGRILVAGAGPENVEMDWHAYSTAEIYDPASGRWSLIDQTGWIPARELRQQGVPDWALDLGTGGWPLSAGTLVPLPDGGAVLVGVSEWAKHEGEETRSFRFAADGNRRTEIGTPWLAVWENLKPYRSYTSPEPRWLGAAVVTLPDGRVLVAGGGGDSIEAESDTTREARLYNPATNRWRKAPAMPLAPGRSTGVLLADGSVLVAGDGGFLRYYPGT
jgi:hypothetical protein